MGLQGGGIVIKFFFRALLILLALVLVVGIVFAVSQWDNLRAVYTASTSSSEDIITKAENSKKEQKAFFEEYDINVAPPSLEDIEGLLNGTVTTDDAKVRSGLAESSDIAVGEGETDIQASAPAKTPAPSQTSDTPDAAAKETQTSVSQNEANTVTESQDETQIRKPTSQELIDQCVRSLYAYEIDLMAEIGVLKQAAINEYHSLPEEQQTRDKLRQIGLNGLNKCYDLEVVADRNVKSLLNKLKSDLNEIGSDTSVTDTLWRYYCDEKSNTKDFYLNKYL